MNLTSKRDSDLYSIFSYGSNSDANKRCHSKCRKFLKATLFIIALIVTTFLLVFIVFFQTVEFSRIDSPCHMVFIQCDSNEQISANQRPKALIIIQLFEILTIITFIDLLLKFIQLILVKEINWLTIKILDMLFILILMPLLILIITFNL